MSIRQTTPMSEINAYIEMRIKRITEAIVYNLHYVAEECLNAARQTNSYRDQTGNLRSSLGYVIVVDGRTVHESAGETILNGDKGEKDGKRYAKEVARRFPEGIVLIVVAGMEYAAYVSARGYDVIDSAETLAKSLVPQMLRQLGFTK